MDNLQTMLLDNHPYIGHYCHTYELIREKPVEEQEAITIRLHVNLQQDQRTHNLPTAEEIAVIIPEDGCQVRSRAGQSGPELSGITPE